MSKRKLAAGGASVGALGPLDGVDEPDELSDIAPEPPETATDPVEADAPSPGELALEGCVPLPTVPVQAPSSETIAVYAASVEGVLARFRLAMRLLGQQALSAARLGLKMRVFMGVESLSRRIIVAARRPSRLSDGWERGASEITNSRL